MPEATLTPSVELLDAEKHRAQCVTELARAKQALREAEQALAVAQERAALAGCGDLREFQAKWRRLLDSVQSHGDSAYQELRQELLAIAGGRRMLLANITSRIRTDNRQRVLELFIPTDPELFERTFQFVIRIAELLCNYANPEPDAQAGMLEVMTRGSQTSAWITLYLDPRAHRYEVQETTRMETKVLHQGLSIRDALVYLRDNHAYYA